MDWSQHLNRLLAGVWVILAFINLNTIKATYYPTLDTYNIILLITIWASWLLIFISTIVPSTLSLTLTRVFGPLFLTIAIYASSANPGSILQLANGSLFIILLGSIYSSKYSHIMINGSAYGSETRFLLKTPIAFLLLLALPVYALVIISSITAILTTKYHQSIGLILLPATVAVWPFIVRFMNNLSRRWLVFVPAGLVLHDYLTIKTPVLMKKNNIDTITTYSQQDALDLTAGTSGYSSLIELKNSTNFELHRDSNETSTNAIRVAPSLPGALLKEVRLRGINQNSSKQKP